MSGTASRNIGGLICSEPFAPATDGWRKLQTSKSKLHPPKPRMSDEAMLIRRGVVCASGIIYWVGVLIQARRVRRHIGRSPNLKPRGKKERLLWVGWFLVILAWILQPIFIRIPGANGADGLWSLELGLWTSWLNPISIVLGLIL